jgi:hypothetical protein
MSLELFNITPAGSIEVLVDEQNQPWFKRAHVGKFLGIRHIDTSLEGLDIDEMRARSAFGAIWSNTPGWSGSRGDQNKTDIFVA